MQTIEIVYLQGKWIMGNERFRNGEEKEIDESVCIDLDKDSNQDTTGTGIYGRNQTRNSVSGYPELEVFLKILVPVIPTGIGMPKFRFWLGMDQFRIYPRQSGKGIHQ